MSAEHVYPRWSFIRYLIATAIGSLIILQIFDQECANYVGIWSKTLEIFSVLLNVFSSVFSLIPELIVLYLLKFPAPETDAWQTVFALAFFHQARTICTELREGGSRGWGGGTAFLLCGTIGAGFSYAFGVVLPSASSYAITVFVASLYGFLEFVRYSILAFFARGAENFWVGFKRRQTSYTIWYLLIAIATSSLIHLRWGHSPPSYHFLQWPCSYFLGYSCLPQKHISRSSTG